MTRSADSKLLFRTSINLAGVGLFSTVVLFFILPILGVNIIGALLLVVIVLLLASIVTGSVALFFPKGQPLSVVGKLLWCFFLVVISGVCKESIELLLKLYI